MMIVVCYFSLLVALVHARITEDNIMFQQVDAPLVPAPTQTPSSPPALHALVCLVVVSTDKRPRMVYDTIESFERYNTYPLHQRVLVSDSHHNVTYLHKLREDPRWTIVLSHAAGDGRWTRYFGFIDHVYHHVLKQDCRWVFFMEDDFLWQKSGFIELGMEVTQQNHDTVTMFIPLDPVWKKNWDREKGIQTTNNVSWVWARRRHIWGGFSFHPHLMHLQTRYYGDIIEGCFACFMNEAHLSRHFMRRNMFIARRDSAEHLYRLDALLSQVWPGFSFPRVALPFHDRLTRRTSRTRPTLVTVFGEREFMHGKGAAADVRAGVPAVLLGKAVYQTQRQ